MCMRAYTPIMRFDITGHRDRPNLAYGRTEQEGARSLGHVTWRIYSEFLAFTTGWYITSAYSSSSIYRSCMKVAQSDSRLWTGSRNNAITA